MPHWTTIHRPVHEQPAYWREVICEAFTPLATDRLTSGQPSDSRAPGTQSWVESTSLGSTNCAEVVSNNQLMSHGVKEVRRTNANYVFVNLQLRGQCAAQQGNRTCVIPAGGFAMFDTTSEYRLELLGEPATQAWRVVTFRVPRARLVPLLADPNRFTAVAHDAQAGGLPGLIAANMMSIWGKIASFDDASARAAEDAFIALLAAAAGGGPQLRESGQDDLDAAMKASINRYVAVNLRRGHLSVGQVCQRFGISPRKLHLLFAGTDRSFAQTVMTLRVEACARELRIGDEQTSLTDVATRWGFCDLSHLNRVFRKHFGCLPSQYRHEATSR